MLATERRALEARVRCAEAGLQSADPEVRQEAKDCLRLTAHKLSGLQKELIRHKRRKRT